MTQRDVFFARASGHIIIYRGSGVFLLSHDKLWAQLRYWFFDKTRRAQDVLNITRQSLIVFRKKRCSNRFMTRSVIYFPHKRRLFPKGRHDQRVPWQTIRLTWAIIRTLFCLVHLKKKRLFVSSCVFRFFGLRISPCFRGLSTSHGYFFSFLFNLFLTFLQSTCM